jgi:hypothetical protein
LVWLILRSRIAGRKDVNFDVLVPERSSNLLHWTAQSQNSPPPCLLCCGPWEVLVGPEVHNEISGFLSHPITALSVFFSDKYFINSTLKRDAAWSFALWPRYWLTDLWDAPFAFSWSGVVRSSLMKRLFAQPCHAPNLRINARQRRSINLQNAAWLGDGDAVVQRSYGHLAPKDAGQYSRKRLANFMLALL